MQPDNPSDAFVDAIDHRRVRRIVVSSHCFFGLNFSIKSLWLHAAHERKMRQIQKKRLILVFANESFCLVRQKVRQILPSSTSPGVSF